MRTNIQIIKENIKQELKQRGSNIQTLCKDLKTDRLYIYTRQDGKLFCFHIGNRIGMKALRIERNTEAETSFKFGKRFAQNQWAGVFFEAVRAQFFFAPRRKYLNYE